MRDELNKSIKAAKRECLVFHIDHSSNNRTHWTSLCIKDGLCYYFDSFGFPPPIEVEKYLLEFENLY